MVKRRRFSEREETSPRRSRLGAYAFAHSLGLICVIALLFYAVTTWFGSYDSSVILDQYPISFSFYDWTIIIGLIEGYVFGYVFGWIFAKMYNRVLREN